MLMDQQPGCAAAFPNTSVADFGFGGFAVLRSERQMHRYGGPSDVAAPRNLQVFSGCQLPCRNVVKKILLYAGVVFLPAVVGKRCNVVENHSVILGVKLRWIVGISGTPRGAIIIYQSAKCCFLSGFLLRVRANKRQRSAE